MGSFVLLGALALEPALRSEPDLSSIVVTHGIASATLATWSLMHRAGDDDGLLPWTAFVTELVVVPALPRIAQGRWSSAIVWGSVILATATAGRIATILNGDRMTFGTLGAAYGAPMALSGAALVRF